MSDIKELKAQADKLGVTYSPNIGLETLQGRVRKAIIKNSEANATVTAPKEETEAQRRMRKTKAATKLVRVRVTCMDTKQKLKGGVNIQVANDLVGTVGKFVQFNVPWHVPQILLNVLEEKQHQTFVEGRSVHGVTVKRSQLVKTFAIEKLPPLTAEEFEDLKNQQAIANNIKDV